MPNTPSIAVFLDAEFPCRGEVVAAWERVLPGLPGRPPEESPSHSKDLGVLFEYIVAADLAEAPVDDALLSYLGEEDRVRFLHGLGYAREPCGAWRLRQRCDLPLDDGQLGVLQILAGLAAPSRLHRSKPHRSIEERRGLMLALKEHGFLDSAAELLPDLLTLWETHLRIGRSQLAGLGGLRAVAPMFAPGYGVGDLIVGRAVVEVKVHRDPAEYLQDYLDQLLRYLLLDFDDQFGLDSVAVYLGWQGGLLTADLAEIAQGAAVDLEAARRRFHTTFREELDFRRRWYEIETR